MGVFAIGVNLSHFSFVRAKAVNWHAHMSSHIDWVIVSRSSDYSVDNTLQRMHFSSFLLTSWHAFCDAFQSQIGLWYGMRIPTIVPLSYDVWCIFAHSRSIVWSRFERDFWQSHVRPICRAHHTHGPVTRIHCVHVCRFKIIECTILWTKYTIYTGWSCTVFSYSVCIVGCRQFKSLSFDDVKYT